MTKLDSWKEIAAYLGRRVRTVQRWERDERLPVHRHHHRKRGTVYAFTEELDSWRASRADTAEEVEGKSTRNERAAAAEDKALSPAEPRRFTSPGRGWVLRSAAALLALALVGWGALSFLPLRRQSRGLTPPGASSRSSAEGQVPASDGPAISDLALGEYLLHRNRTEQLESAIVAFERAATTAPTDWRGHAGLAQALARSGHEGLASPRLVFPPARAAASRALALAPGQAEALAARAWVEYEYDWQLDQAEVDLRAALSRQPRLGFALQAMAHLSSARGRHEEAIAFLRRAQSAQPLSAALNIDGCWFFFRARRFAEALAEARHASALEPDSSGPLVCRLETERLSGDLEAARRTAIELARKLGAPSEGSLASVPAAEALRRWYEFLVGRAERAVAHRWVSPGAVAALHAVLGQRDQAFTCLERGFAERDPFLLVLAIHPDFDALRADPRLRALTDRVARAGPPTPASAGAAAPRYSRLTLPSRRMANLSHADPTLPGVRRTFR